MLLWEFSFFGAIKAYSRWWDDKKRDWPDSCFIEYFHGDDTEMAVVGMHGKGNKCPGYRGGIDISGPYDKDGYV